MSRDPASLSPHITAVLEAISTGEGSHAYLLAGPAGSTGQLAMSIAQAAVCHTANRPCEGCAACESVASHRHIDVRWIEAVTTSIKVEQVRTFRADVWLEPIVADRKVYIIKEAERMTPEAANALLKVLEEPPRHALIVLTTANPRNLLATVLSRCQLVAVDDGDARVSDRVREMAKDIISVCEGPRPDRLIAMVNSIIDSKDEAPPAELVCELSSELGRRLEPSGDRERLLALADCMSLAEGAAQFLSRNANVKLCLDALLVRIHARLNGSGM